MNKTPEERLLRSGLHDWEPGAAGPCGPSWWEGGRILPLGRVRVRPPPLTHHREPEAGPDAYKRKRMKSVLGIRDILVRIRILGTVPLTNGSGCGFLTLEHLHHSSKIKSHKEDTKQ